LRQIRILLAHAMGGLKRSTIVVQGFRNRKAEFEDDAVGIWAGLWNFALSYSGTTLLSVPQARLVAVKRNLQRDELYDILILRSA
jgi:hypothetical protein